MLWDVLSCSYSKICAGWASLWKCYFWLKLLESVSSLWAFTGPQLCWQTGAKRALCSGGSTWLQDRLSLCQKLKEKHSWVWIIIIRRRKFSSSPPFILLRVIHIYQLIQILYVSKPKIQYLMYWTTSRSVFSSVKNWSSNPYFQQISFVSVFQVCCSSLCDVVLSTWQGPHAISPLTAKAGTYLSDGLERS